MPLARYYTWPLKNGMPKLKHVLASPTCRPSNVFLSEWYLPPFQYGHCSRAYTPSGHQGLPILSPLPPFCPSWHPFSGCLFHLGYCTCFLMGLLSLVTQPTKPSQPTQSILFTWTVIFVGNLCYFSCVKSFSGPAYTPEWSTDFFVWCVRKPIYGLLCIHLFSAFNTAPSFLMYRFLPDTQTFTRVLLTYLLLQNLSLIVVKLHMPQPLSWKLRSAMCVAPPQQWLCCLLVCPAHLSWGQTMSSTWLTIASISWSVNQDLLLLIVPRSFIGILFRVKGC